MITKQIILFLCLSGTLGGFADNYKTSEKDDNYKIEHYDKKHWKKSRDPADQFEKDYKNWDRKYTKPDRNRAKSFHMETNKVDSNEYIDRYNLYGNTFNPNLIHVNKRKVNYHEKQSDDKPDKFVDLTDDINVNYNNNNKEFSSESEWIPEQKPEISLLHDTDVNFLNNNHFIHGIDVNYINNNEEPKNENKENFKENYQNGNGLYVKKFKHNFYNKLRLLNFINPPSHNDTIQMARYIVHVVDWASLGTISSRAPTKGAPFVCVKAISDGMVNASSGVPFFYMSPMDLCTQDLQKDNRVSVLVTLSQTEYCKNQQLDPQDPRCAKLMLSGKIKKINPGSEEEKFAKTALFSRHPEMASWPADHNWYFSKLKIGQIILLDYFGGATYIKVKDYLNGGPMEPELRK